MSTQTKKNNTFRITELPEEMAEKAREIWLAGLGALSAVEEEGSKLFTNLVSKGESYEQKRQEQVSKLLSEATAKPMELAGKPMELAGEMQDQVSNRLENAFAAALDRFGVPTRKEVRDLTKMVQSLTRKVETLAKTLEAQEAPAAQKPATQKTTAKKDRATYHVVPHEEGWAVKKEGADRATSVHSNKEEALEQGREVARTKEPSQLVVHKKDGTIQDTFAYGA